MNFFVNIFIDFIKFKLFNVEINVLEEMVYVGWGGYF